MKIFLPIVLLLVSATGISGCGESVDPQVLALRQKLVVATAPEKERPIAEIRKDLKSGELKPESTFVVRARINAGDFPPFADGMAAFVVTDATGHDGDETHNPHECPFCKRDIINVIARVEFEDESGIPLKTDSRELFDVKEFDLLVIEGKGRFDEDDTLIIAADKVFVKR